MEIAGQAAIVSGGASGLGRATAEALIAAGVKVTILASTRRRRPPRRAGWAASPLVAM
jgi:NAD(P)-dependent dehydrogenase (short-subunit alcohol dehydrogenase family)